MEKEVYFVFDMRKMNFYFKNVVMMEGKVLKVFDDMINKYCIYFVLLLEMLFCKGKQLQYIMIWLGLKVLLFDMVENCDDFLVKNV